MAKDNKVTEVKFDGSEWFNLFKNKELLQKNYKGKYTRDQIKAIAQKISNDVKKKKGYEHSTFKVTLKYPNGRYYSGKSAPVGDRVNLFKMGQFYDDDHAKYWDEPDHFREFSLYINKKGNI